ncbi:MAG: potassium transporter [Gammaproteobacteria bacterium]|nr:MAG: potassium transporter [Gammaproteobacteria bacterium]
MTNSLLQQAIVYLGAAVVVVPLVKRLNFSAVLGYLLAGIVVGPYLLGLVGVSEAEREQVMHFAEFGVVMMLFIIGLELRPSHLWRLRGPIVGMGGTQVLLTATALSAIAMLLGLDMKAAIAVGLILSLSSTAIVLQTLNERGMTRTPTGINIFSVLLFQDIAVIPILAILPLLAMDVSTKKQVASHSLIAGQAAWLQVSAVLGSIAVIVLVGHFVLRHIFRFVASTKIHELFTALTLFLVFGITLLMEVVGLSPALGAFVAGVVLAESEYRHQIALDIEPFEGLLLGLLFMTVGSSIDFHLFGQSFIVVVGLVVGLTVIKILMLLIIAAVFKMNPTKKMLFSFALAQAGEFAFVLFGMTITLNVLPVALVKLLILVVALSMMLTPLLMMLLDRLILPRVNKIPIRDSDEIEGESNAVIIAGYGRFGRMIGRLLKANGIESTVLDFNSDHVETIRRFGQKVYYGDATRLDLLESAGIKEAKILIVAIADREKSVHLVQQVRQTFPHVNIFVRATSRAHAYDLIEYGVTFERETLMSALQMGESVLKDLGFHPYRAKRASKLFQKHDRAVLRALYSSYRKNHNEYIESSKENERIIAQTLRADMAGMDGSDYGWSVVLSDEDAEQVITDDEH